MSFSAPASATGEDIIEIHCHGSQAVMSAILDILAAAPGLRVAIAGEFTRQALENGKMDITQAEGLADLIDAETSLQRRQATAQMQGTLSKPVLAWRQDIIELSALLEALIDFADEELPPETVAHITVQRQLLLDNLRMFWTMVAAVRLLGTG
jgi:tRNA modification GTPase